MTSQQTQRRYVSVADTAKLLRAALKAQWPLVKFSVKSKSYSGGASIDIGWTDGPLGRDVDEVAHLYRGATFDGMTDMKSHHDTLLAGPDGLPELVHFGADFIFCERRLSDDYSGILAAWAQHALDHSGTHNREPFGLDAYYPLGIACAFGLSRAHTSGSELVRWLSQHVAPNGEPYEGRG
jgi:hypothetical protein